MTGFALLLYNMPKFFLTDDKICGSQIFLTKENAKHCRVLRLKPDERVTASCGGIDYKCRFVSFTEDGAVLEIIETFSGVEPNTKITLFQGIPKGDGMDYVIQKSVELGVTKIVPMITERTVAIPKDTEKKLIRYQKIAEAAAKQSGRGNIPEIEKIARLDKIQKESLPSSLLVAYEKADGSPREAMSKISSNEVGIFIGPEGGFSQKELDRLIAFKADILSLGRRILRTETAGMVAIALLLYERGDL